MVNKQFFLDKTNQLFDDFKNWLSEENFLVEEREIELAEEWWLSTES